MISSTTASGPSIAVNAYGSPDYNIYPHMQLWVNGILVGEWDVTGTAQTYAATVPGAALHYYHADHLGSTRLETDANGAVVANCTYLPFGQEWSCSASDPANHYKFTGHERDAESGLDHSGMGRWLSPDPLAGSVADPQSLNRYAYVRNDPVNLIDPLGLRWVCTYSTIEGQQTTPSCRWVEDGSEMSVDPFGDGRCFWVTGAPWGTMGGGGTRLYCPPRASTLGGEVDPPGLRRLLEELSWLATYAKEAVQVQKTRTGPGSCLQVALDTFKPGYDAVKSGFENVKKLANPATFDAAALAAGVANALANNLGPLTRSPIGRPIADPGMGAALITGATAAAAGARNLAIGAQAAVPYIPYVAAGALEVVGAYAVAKEAHAAFTGQCKP